MRFRTRLRRVGTQLVVLAAERHDLQPRLDAAQPGDAIGLEAGAVDERAARAPGRARVSSTISPPLRRTRSTRAPSRNLAAAGAHQLGEHLHDARVVDDAGLRDVQPGDAGDVRLELADLLGPEPPHAVEAVRAPAALELVERRQLASRRGDDDLAAALVRHAVLLAEAVHELAALDAVPRLQRARLVVEAGVDDAAVVAGLVRRRARPRPRARPASRAAARRARGRSRCRRCRRR